MKKPLEHRMAEALEGQRDEPAVKPRPSTQRPKASDTPDVASEQARRKAESHADDRSKDERLVQMGRGDQTHG